MLIPFVQFFNSIAYDLMKHKVLPWMHGELDRLDSRPGFLVKLVGLVESWCRRYEKKNLEA